MEKRILFILTGFFSGAGISLFVFYNLFNHFPSVFEGSIVVIVGGLAGVIQLWAFYRISHWISTKIPPESRFSLKVGLDFLINSITGIVFTASLLLIILKITSADPILTNWTLYSESFLTMWILELMLVIIYTIVMLGYYAYYHYAQGQVAEMKIERKQLKLQFEALKGQLSPHFLFNSLNTISSLIHNDSKRAEEFIRRLADTYHYVLRTHQQQLIPLESELEFVKAYYYLLLVRYEEGLRLNINIPDDLYRNMVPPLTIQILIENAIKHNIIDKEEPLIINIDSIDNTRIRILNNKTQPAIDVSSTKVGLSNLKKRYTYFTKTEIKIIDENDFEVIIPVLNNNKESIAA